VEVNLKSVLVGCGKKGLCEESNEPLMSDDHCVVSSLREQRLYAHRRSPLLASARTGVFKFPPLVGFVPSRAPGCGTGLRGRLGAPAVL